MMQKNQTIKIELVLKILTYIAVTMGFLSVFKYVGLFYSAIFMLLYLLSLSLEYKKNFLLPRWLLNSFSISLIAVSFFRFVVDDFATVVAETLLILLAIKLLEDKKFRDYMQIYLLTVFLLAGSALLTLNVFFLLYLLCLIFLLAVALVMLAYYSEDSSLELGANILARIVYKILLIPLLSIPVTTLMFVVLPRTNIPVLNFLSRESNAKSGFSDTVTLGSVSNIQEDATAIFRAKTEKIDENYLYWRGVTLDYYDGKAWKNTFREAAERRGQPIEGQRMAVSQTIYLEPYENKYLFALDKPVAIALRNASWYSDFTYSLPDAISRRIRYEAVSSVSDVIPGELINRGKYLQLPDGNMQRTRELVKGLSPDGGEAALKAILRFLKGGNYSYSLRNLPLSDNPLEDFLFAHRYGNCEYFASAMAIMLRIAGIPSRVVGGYRGGYYNEVGGYYLLLQKNAHVWVEAYIDDKGWVRADPTPAVIEDFTSAARKGLVFKIKLLFDSIQYHWNTLIINYDFANQMSLFYKVRTGIKIPPFSLSAIKSKTALYFATALALLLAAIISYLLFSSRKSSEEKILNIFLKKLERRGYKKLKAEGLEEFVSKIADRRIMDRAFVFVREFEKSFYRDRKLTKDEIRKLKKIVKLLFTEN